MKKKILAVLILAAVAGACYFFFTRKRPRAFTETPPQKTSAPLSEKYNVLAMTSSFFTDLENPDPSLWNGTYTNEKYFSGTNSCKLSPADEYGVTFSKKVSELPGYDKLKQARISFRILSGQPLQKSVMVFSVMGTDNKTSEWKKETIAGGGSSWKENELVFDIDPKLWPANSTFKIYPWNPGKESFFIDDIGVEFFGDVERESAAAIGPQQNFFFDYEPAAGETPGEKISSDVAHSGNYSCKLPGSDTYSETVAKKISEISTDTVKFISASVWIYPKDDNPIVTLVVSVEKPNGEALTWQGKATDKMNLKKNQWHKINFRADLREVKTAADDVTRIYVWNKQGGTVYADDLEIVYGDPPGPRGIPPFAYFDAAGHLSAGHEKNKPPFLPSWLIADTSHATSSVFLIDDNGKKDGELKPGSILLSGNFIGTKDGRDNLLTADGNSWSVYNWCDQEKKWKKLFSAENGINTSGKTVLSGCFSDPGKSEVLVIGSGDPAHVQSVSFVSNSDPCRENSGGLKANTAASSISGIDFMDSTFILTGNFTGNGCDEILFISKTDGRWKLAGKRGDQIEVIGSGKISHGKIAAANRISTASGYDQVIFFPEMNHKLDYCMAGFGNSPNDMRVKDFKDKSFLDYFGADAEFISIPAGKSALDLFYLNQDWRLDLKKVHADANGIFVDAQVDFEQPDASRNPKFYEYTKIIAGHFFDASSKDFLVLMRNCADTGFDGKSCSAYEEIPEMPSGTTFYHYQQPR